MVSKSSEPATPRKPTLRRFWIACVTLSLVLLASFLVFEGTGASRWLVVPDRGSTTAGVAGVIGFALLVGDVFLPVPSSVVMVAASRPVPILAETVAIVAGASAMRPARAALSGALGSLPAAALYAWAGSRGFDATNDAALFALVIVIAAVLWWVGERQRARYATSSGGVGFHQQAPFRRIASSARFLSAASSSGEYGSKASTASSATSCSFGKLMPSNATSGSRVSV
jgi:hypothetical protein